MEQDRDSWYEIEARPVELGEGWRLFLYQKNPETGEIVDMGGGVFPVSAYASGLEDDSKEAASKEAYADAMQTGQDWLNSRAC